MNELREIFERAAITTGGPDLHFALLGLLVALALGMFISWVYMGTHSGLSYSQSFAQSLVVLTVIVCLVMLVIGNNLLTAFGLLGALAVIRFRNVLKDTRDTTFVFFALVCGMAAGSGRPLLGGLGAVVVAAVVFFLRVTAFGARERYDSFLRFVLDEGATSLEQLSPLLQRHCRTSRLVSRRSDRDTLGEFGFRLTLRDPMQVGRMLEELRGTRGVSEVSMVVQEEQSEV